MRTFILTAFLLLTSCGIHTNMLEPYAEPNGFEQAQRNMESGEYATAQEQLEEFIDENPAHAESQALLAACHAAQGGVSILSFLTQAIAKMAEAGGTPSDPLALMEEILPDASAENITALEESLEVATALSAANTTDDMKFAFGIYGTAYIFLTLEALSNSAAAQAALTDAQADSWFAALEATQDWQEGSSSPVSAILTTLITALDALPGSSREKLLVLSGATPTVGE